MPQHRLLSACLILCTVIFFQCHNEPTESADTVEIFALKNYEWMGNSVCAVNPDKAELEKQPLVTNDDIVSYSKSDFILEFKEEGAKNVKAIAPRQPFAVVVGGEVLFYGVCMQSIMSSSCLESITLENLSYGPTKAKLQNGYPGIDPSTSSLKDWRTDQKLLDAFENQGKLKP